MIALLLNHLWQSSLCVGGAGLLALALHRNAANVRFWLWFAASVKFLVPFAAVTALGAALLTPIVPPMAAPTVTLMEPLAKPFSATVIALVSTGPSAHAALPTPPALPAQSAFHLDLQSIFLVLWALGFLFLALRWAVRWSRMRALLREAAVAAVDAPISVKFSASRLEPGLVGILRPVILLPQGIEQQLSPAEMKAVLAHELCHWRRHDNLLAAIHMLVEALFWFFPLVWWLGARLNAERERACDESVLADGNDPEMYAEGILKVCRAYLQSPLACVAGVSGAGLKKRLETIMENRLILQLNAARKFVLGTSAAAALALPLALGLTAAPVAQMQAKAEPIPPLPRSTEQARPPASETSTAALPSGQLARNPVEQKAVPAPTPETTNSLRSQIEAVAKPGNLPAPSPAAPIIVASNGSAAPASDNQPVIPPAAHAPSVQAQSNNPAVLPARTSSRALPDETPEHSVVCQPPEVAALSKQADKRLCVQKELLTNLAVTGPQIVAVARAHIRYPFINDFLKDPSTDLQAIACKGGGAGHEVFPSIMTCARNSYWVWKRDHPDRVFQGGDIGPFYSGDNAGGGGALAPGTIAGGIP